MSACILWTGAVFNSGYGHVLRKTYGEVSAHRLAYKRAKGKIPKGLLVLHKCGNRLCINPKHLFLGTQLDNMHGIRVNAKLTSLAAKDIRKARLTPTEYARKYSVSRATIRRVQQNISWRY